MTQTPSTRSPRTTTLAQIVAIVNGTKSRTEKTLTAGYHQAQKVAPMTGVARTYQPRDEDGEQLPPEFGKVQVNLSDIITEVADAVKRLVDVVSIMDVTNEVAKGDIIIDGQVLVADVPVTHLMWLEKQVASLRTFVAKLPALDPTRSWTYDANQEVYRTEPVMTTRTKKVPRNHVKAPATDKHPAQVDVWHEDTVVGDWTRIDYSGALPQSEITLMLQRVDKLLDAIRQARGQANEIPVIDTPLGTPIIGYLFGEFLTLNPRPTATL